MDFIKSIYLAKHAGLEISKRVFKKKWGREKFLRKKLLSRQEANDLIYDRIQAGEPFMVARLGAMETNFIKKINSDCTKPDMKIKESLDNLCNNAGFFPHDLEHGLQYVKVMREAMAEVDLSGVTNWIMEDYLLKTYSKSDKFTWLGSIEPFSAERPWTRALEGKKVLVIHPFAATIEKQYARRELLFENEDILPKFELKTVKAVQTIAGTKDERFETWFDALEYMYQEAMKIDFDVAIIGCGAYGYPLAAKIKQAGKIAIHLGGVTQILFGIKGSRWEGIRSYRERMNEYWVKPDEDEKPQGSSKVEGGCYW